MGKAIRKGKTDSDTTLQLAVLSSFQRLAAANAKVPHCKLCCLDAVLLPSWEQLCAGDLMTSFTVFQVNVPLCTHPAVLVDGPESFHGNISDVAPSEKDLACG